MVTEDSTNLIAELEAYKWKQDRITGASLNEPEDKNNHAIDAVRYVALAKLSQQKERRAPRGRNTGY
jgi:phage terminase large subunit